MNSLSIFCWNLPHFLIHWTHTYIQYGHNVINTVQYVVILELLYITINNTMILHICTNAQIYLGNIWSSRNVEKINNLFTQKIYAPRTCAVKRKHSLSNIYFKKENVKKKKKNSTIIKGGIRGSFENHWICLFHKKNPWELDVTSFSLMLIRDLEFLFH